MDNFNNEKFCDTGFDTKGLYGIIESFYPIGIATIGEIYTAFIDLFHDRIQNADLVKYHSLITRKDEMEILNKKFHIPITAKYLGIDFPTWINFNDNETGQKKRIMIVGIDALRSCEKTMDYLVLGTPYGFHDKCIRDKMKSYWDFIASLSKTYSVYLTDTFKVFYYEGSKSDKLRSSKDSKFTNPDLRCDGRDIHQYIFRKEVELVDPALIITLGQIPQIWFCNGNECRKYGDIKSELNAGGLLNLYYNNGITPILPMPHLSGRNSAQAKSFVDTQKFSEIGTKYAELVQEYLNKLPTK